jgi:hypothetical protein
MRFDETELVVGALEPRLASGSPAVTWATSWRRLWAAERRTTRDGHQGQPTKITAKIAVAD